MNEMTTIDAGSTGARRIDATRGETRGEVSSQWFSRPADQRFLSLDALYESVARRRDSSVERRFDAGQLVMGGSEHDQAYLVAKTPHGDHLRPTHHAFGQLCQLARVGAAANIFRGQPGWLAGLNLNHGLTRLRDEPVKILSNSADGTMRAATGPDYGRIFDENLVGAVRRFAGNGTGDTRWKVPGVIDWRTMSYNPYVDVTSETTTLYSSDRDVFLFLVDDTHPIEIGTLKNGDPDLVFRGFYCWNSEVGTRSLGIATFWLRGVCMNRCLWGVENFEQLRIVHTKHGADRFTREAEPALLRYASSEPTALLAGIKAAKDILVARDDEDRTRFLVKTLGFSLSRAEDILATHEREEGGKPSTAWDFTQGITAVARRIPNQDVRLDMEKTASKLMDRATRGSI